MSIDTNDETPVEDPEDPDHGGTGEAAASTPDVGGLAPGQRVILDWLVTGFLVLAGLIVVAAGYAAFDSVDPEWFTDLVEEGTIRSDVLSEAEVVEVLAEMLWWGGLGAVILGVLLVVVGIGYIAVRRRDHTRAREVGRVSSSLVADAVAGAVATVATSFIPLSAIIGGGVAGYLHGGSRLDGAKAGALSGVLLALAGVFLGGMLLLGLTTADVRADINIVVFIVVLSLLVSIVFNLVLSAVGGYIGVYLAERSSGS
ncbi:MAG: DUF5518 domain-containing protein [Halobacteriales archaeon]